MSVLLKFGVSFAHWRTGIHGSLVGGLGSLEGGHGSWAGCGVGQNGEMAVDLGIL